MVVVPPVLLVERILAPGAQMSTQGPQLLHEVSASEVSVAATMAMPLLVPAPTLAGDCVQASTPSLPAAIE
jgi:hypothetical protein